MCLAPGKERPAVPHTWGVAGNFCFLMEFQLISVIPVRRTWSNSGQLSKSVPWVRLYLPWVVCSVELCLAGVLERLKTFQNHSCQCCIQEKVASLPLLRGWISSLWCSIMQEDHKDTLVRCHLPAFPSRLFGSTVSLLQELQAAALIPHNHSAALLWDMVFLLRCVFHRIQAAA